MVGINGKLLSWICDFFSSRTQMAKINNILSSTFNINNGIPQGSVFGSVLFVIFVDNIVKECKKFNVTIKLYTDHLKVFKIFKSHYNVLELQNFASMKY